jgi:hypothetical protein
MRRVNRFTLFLSAVLPNTEPESHLVWSSEQSAFSKLGLGQVVKFCLGADKVFRAG